MLVDRAKIGNPYFLAYVNAHQIQDGADVPHYAFSAWIVKQHALFRDFKKLQKGQPYNSGLQQEFEKFIGVEVRNDSLQGKLSFA